MKFERLSIIHKSNIKNTTPHHVKNYGVVPLFWIGGPFFLLVLISRDSASKYVIHHLCYLYFFFPISWKLLEYRCIFLVLVTNVYTRLTKRRIISSHSITKIYCECMQHLYRYVEFRNK